MAKFDAIIEPPSVISKCKKYV